MKYFLSTVICLIFIIQILSAKETSPVAVVVNVKGKSVVIRNKDEIKLKQYMPLYVNDILKTYSSSFIEVLFENGIGIKIEENTVFELKNFIINVSNTSNKSSVSIVGKISLGTVLTDTEIFKEKYENSSLHIITPTMVASVRGTVFYVKVLDDETTNIAVFKGEVECSLGHVDEDIFLHDTFEEELESELTKKIVVYDDKQITVSSDLSSTGVVDLSFSLLEYKRTAVAEFIKNVKQYRKEYEKFKKERDKWIEIHKKEFKHEIEEKRRKFKKEFNLKEKGE